MATRVRWLGFELPSRVTVDEDSLSDNYGRFVAEPFERGFGHTIGNSLRRVLLSSIEGAAPYAIKIDGVQHEFSGIEGCVEDVTDIVLNIKSLCVRMVGEEPVVLSIDKKGPGAVTAADLSSHERIEIVNGDLVIATLTADVNFHMDVMFRKGRGYVPDDENIDPNLPVGVIPVDSIFTPVTRVRYSVENTRVGQRTNYDRLVLEIWTDATVRPENALIEASLILRKHINPFVRFYEMGPELPMTGREQPSLESPEARKLRELRDKLSLPVQVLDPSVRAENCLSAEGITTIGDLVRRTEQDMLAVRNFGKTSLVELKRKLADMGLSFGMELPEEVIAVLEVDEEEQQE
ncbi:MAG: DNA-directed RNA polymerase subunit alpha [Planctomycetes bacterium]|nr:DNA-directed RNA polymerase subunit alpha [Planctomycetota bacterium]